MKVAWLMSVHKAVSIPPQHTHMTHNKMHDWVAMGRIVFLISAQALQGKVRRGSSGSGLGMERHRRRRQQQQQQRRRRRQPRLWHLLGRRVQRQWQGEEGGRVLRDRLSPQPPSWSM
jgi:hypothetical protein